MKPYIYFWIFFIVAQAIRHSYKAYKENCKAGYDIYTYETSGKKISFQGGFKEMIYSTLAGMVGLIFSPGFLLIESLKYLPVAFVFYIINYF